jgi:acyl dehydratase
MEPSDLIENRTFDEIAIGDSATLSRTLSKDNIALFAVMSGDVNPAIIDHGMWGGSSCLRCLALGFPVPGQSISDKA